MTGYSGGAPITADPGYADKCVALAATPAAGDRDNAKRNFGSQEVEPQNAEVSEAFALVSQSMGELKAKAARIGSQG